MMLMQSLKGFKGWIQHCIWSQCDNFLVVVSDALVYVFHRNQHSGDFEPLSKYKPHDFPVSDVFWIKSDVWVDPEEIEKNFTENKTCEYSFVTSAYDGTICIWQMQDIIDGKYVVIDKNKIKNTKNENAWDSTVMSYGNIAVECPDIWGKIE
jgi:WD40 repeat protein